MRTERFRDALLLTFVIASLTAPAIFTISPLSVNPVSASPDLAGKTTIGLYSLCSLIIEESAENYEIIVRGKENAYTENEDAYPPQQFYVPGDRPPVMAAKRVDSGAVVAAGISASCRNGRWNAVNNPDKHLDILLDCAFQWMVPGAENVLWYGETDIDYNVYNDADRCSELVGSLRHTYGYRIDNTIDGSFTEITDSLLAGYNILVIPQFELGDAGTGGNPDNLPDVVVGRIENFVRAGGGLLILDGNDHGGWNFCKVQNKILAALNMSIYFQSDSMFDNVNRWGFNYEIYADVDNTTWIGSAYENSTVTMPYVVIVDILPSYQGGTPGATLRYTVTITNAGGRDDNYILTAADTANWSPIISPAELSVVAGRSEIAMLEVRIPSEAPLEAEDSITVTATSLGDPEVSDSIACTASVPVIFSKVDKVKISNPYKNYENWYKGNLHSHTENSDGTNTAEEMVAAYRSKGYSFLAITDHNYITDSEAYTDLPYFLGINGEEITPGMRHMVAIDIENLIEGWWYRSVAEWVEDILDQGGIAIPAHPGFTGAPFPLENLRQAVDAGAKLMEIHGGTMEDAQTARSFWDTLLTESRLVYGVMDDDAHSVGAAGRWGWNIVNAMSLSKSNILESLKEGNFYCVEDSPPGLAVGPEIYSITVENENVISISSSGNHVVFIGDNGVVLGGEYLIGGIASSSIPFGVSYIRMEVYGDNGGISYTQPMMVSSVKFNLVTLCKISLNTNLWLENGSKVVAKFYGYDNVYQAESVFENFVPPTRIVKFENVSHPENEPIEKVVLQATGENTENVISTIASFTVSRGVSVDISPSYQAAAAGQTLNYRITVTNMGNVLDSYVLAAADNAGWGPTLLDNLLENIGPGENETVMLSVSIPRNSLPCMRDNIVIVVTSTTDNTVSDTDWSVAHACGNVLFTLENLYAVGLDTSLYLEEGSKLVVKFYTYEDAFENESFFWGGNTPAQVEKDENVPHPESIGVKKARLDLTYDNTENIVSTIASFTVHRSDLMARIAEIDLRWPYAPFDERSVLMKEIADIDMQWAYAPF